MANPYFLGCDLSVPTYTWSVGVNSSYPVSNLATYFASDVSKANGTTVSQSLVADMGSAVSCNTVVIAGHNFSSTGATTVYLEAADDSGFTVNYVAVSNLVSLVGNTVILSTFNAVSRRYWRIFFDKASSLSAAPQIGNLFLGTRLQFESTYEWDFAKENAEYQTNETVSLNGAIRTSQSYAGRKRWDLQFRLQSSTFKTSWDTFLGVVRGKLRPFYFVDADGTTINYVHLDADYTDVKGYRYNQNNFNVRLKSQLTA